MLDRIRGRTDLLIPTAKVISESLSLDTKSASEIFCLFEKLSPSGQFWTACPDDEKIPGRVFRCDEFLDAGHVTGRIQIKSAEGVGDHFSEPVRLCAVSDKWFETGRDLELGPDFFVTAR